jgi:hypothetical protein
VETLTIQAASRGSAQAMLAALSEFGAGSDRDHGRCEVVVNLRGSDREIVTVLNALEAYVTQRARGPARLELNGRSYVMHPEQESGSSAETRTT